jgi:integrase
MAQITKRTNAKGTTSWRVRIRVQGYPERSKTFPTKGAAKEWAATIEADLARGAELISKESRAKTVADMVDRYIEHYLPFKDHNKDAEKTKALLLWWKARIGAYALANVNAALITEVRDELRGGRTYRGKRRSPKTCNRYLAAISHAFKIAAKELHWLNRSPMDSVGRYSEGKGRVRFLDDDERARLLQACRESRNDKLYALVILALSTGARHGELINLRWKQIDRERGTVLLEDTKNDERRTLHLIPPVLAELKKLDKVRHLKSDLVFAGTKNP